MRWLAWVCGALALCCAGTAAGGAAREKQREGKLKVGTLAPDFELKVLDGEGTMKLSSFRDKRPVVLIFGSYT